MSVRLPILDLQTTPHRTYELRDSLWRARVTICIETEPATVISHSTAAQVMTALIASVAGYPFELIRCDRVPLRDLPRTELRSEYEVHFVHEPEFVGKVTFVVEEDMALDGDAETWQRMEATTQNLLQFGGALQLWLNLNQPV